MNFFPLLSVFILVGLCFFQRVPDVNNLIERWSCMPIENVYDQYTIFRENEIELIVQYLLEEDGRIVNIIGEPGVGKKNIALTALTRLKFEKIKVPIHVNLDQETLKDALIRQFHVHSSGFPRKYHCPDGKKVKSFYSRDELFDFLTRPEGEISDVLLMLSGVKSWEQYQLPKVSSTIVISEKSLNISGAMTIKVGRISMEQVHHYMLLKYIPNYWWYLRYYTGQDSLRELDRVDNKTLKAIAKYTGGNFGILDRICRSFNFEYAQHKDLLYDLKSSYERDLRETYPKRRITSEPDPDLAVEFFSDPRGKKYIFS